MHYLGLEQALYVCNYNNWVRNCQT